MVLIKSSATTLLLSETKLTKSALCEDDVIVIQYNVAFAGQDTEAQKDVIQEIINYLKSKGKRVVDDAEIRLTTLNCSTSKYCNPDFNFTSEVIKQAPNQNAPENILAQESLEPSQTIKRQNVIINESLTQKLNSSNDDSIGASKRKLSEEDGNTSNVNKKLAVETGTQTNSNKICIIL